MAHELTEREDGTVEMTYTGAKPWHGLGVEVDHAMTASEAIEKAGLDWDVECELVYVSPAMAEIPNKQAIVRSDTREVFNVFSKAYTPVQNRDAFTFFDGVVGAGEAVYETAGSLRGGRRIWILAKLPGDLKLDDKDILEKYILLANSHDGSMQVTMKITPVRVVCNNTLEVATMRDFDNGGNTARFRHTVNILNRMNSIRDLLGLTDAHFELFMRQVERLAEAKFTEGDMRAVAEAAINLTEARATKARKDKVDQIVALYYNGIGTDLVTSNGTGWGAFNAVTEFLDHNMAVAGSRSKNPNALAVAGQRMDISWFGYGREMRQRAWNTSLALALSK